MSSETHAALAACRIEGERSLHGPTDWLLSMGLLQHDRNRLTTWLPFHFSCPGGPVVWPSKAEASPPPPLHLFTAEAGDRKGPSK